MGLSRHAMELLYFLSLGALQIVNVDLVSLSLCLLISTTAQFWVSDHQNSSGTYFYVDFFVVSVKVKFVVCFVFVLGVRLVCVVWHARSGLPVFVFIILSFLPLWCCAVGG
jgi:hypothetical protein